jgi:5'-3' exonuclease
MDMYLIDGTYELFRHYFAIPGARDVNGQEVAAVRGVLASVLTLLEHGVTHIAVATDKIIESFRNDLYPYYKTSAGIEPDLWLQFPILEESLEAMGVVVWAMVEFEADDALAAAAAKAALDTAVDKVFICTPDKDLSQSVVGTRIVQLDRRREIVRDEAGVIEKFGVKPQSIPDYLGLVGDTADGYPGLAGWGSKAASSVLAPYPHYEDIPKDAAQWSPSIRNSKKLAATLFDAWDDALLFRKLATLRLDAPTFDKLDDLRWRGATPSFEAVATRMNAPQLFRRATTAAAAGASQR